MSVSSSQGNPADNTARPAQLDDYVGRHASPPKAAASDTALSPVDRYLDHALQLDSDHPSHSRPDQLTQNRTDLLSQSKSDQLSQQPLGLWGVESSSPSRQQSVVARAELPPQRQKSSISLKSEPAQSGFRLAQPESLSSSLRVPHHDNYAGRLHKSPARAPSRLRGVSTEAEVYCNADDSAAPSQESSVEELRTHSQQQRSEDCADETEAKQVGRRRGKLSSHAHDSSSSDGDHRHNTATARRGADHKHSPSKAAALQQNSAQCFQHNSAGHASVASQQRYSADRYFSKAKVREALSPHKPTHSQQYTARARVLDLHDNCGPTEEASEERGNRSSPRAHQARAAGQNGAQVVA